MTPKQIREANNSFPSEVQRIYDAAAAEIERLQAELSDAEVLAGAYEVHNSMLMDRLKELTRCLPGSRTEVIAAQETIALKP